MTSEWIRRRGLVILLAVCLLALCAGEAGARGPAINEIQPYDTIFIHEEGLDLSQLRNATTNNPITALQRYQDGNPDRALLKSIPVADDTSFTVQDFLVNGEFGTYHAYNPQDGARALVFIREPQIFLDVVLASPYHHEPLAGLTVSRNTRIAFRVTSPDVGSFYQAGGAYPATVDIVLTTPGGAESTVISGVNLAGQNVSSTRFYTDDPGRPGPIELSGLREYGTYTARAVWRTPAAFDASAPDSEPVTFTVGNRVGVDATPTPTPAVTPTPTATPTPVPTTPAATPTPTVTPTVTVTETMVPATTPTPTAAPLPVAAAIAALGLAVILAGRRR
ncbi:DUF3821 domain-containing protein [Methanoculleus sp. Wushi-C6]|uniref:DUF3821 domain-containing protein n=1 Tax=Methanoculleus caldifontis TaxID=2651577 RepID=A0ABU3WZA2_9EURY|nr:DUF3821 domain-containing protein [Methanoculleus sp. Wushi-C6]MDV2481119.1 DUF3821 domain-containing protein [Methanoculleus sp. Wushi-C6]